MGEGENHEHSPIKYSTIFSENGYNGSIVLQQRKREKQWDHKERKGGKKTSIIVLKCVFSSSSPISFNNGGNGYGVIFPLEKDKVESWQNRPHAFGTSLTSVFVLVLHAIVLLQQASLPLLYAQNL